MKLLITILLTVTSIYATNLSDYINNQNCSQIIDKQVYTICYDYKAKGAKYVAYTLDGNKVNAVNIKKRPRFYTEKTLPKKYRSTSRDYVHSGYDRGHLANDASFDWSKKSVRKTYSMANIIPQAPTVNRRTWIKAEKLERRIASKLGEVSVINGVIYSRYPKRIGKDKIAVPDGFWKMIYNDDKNYKKCFYYKNDLSAVAKGDKLRNHIVGCNKLTDKNVTISITNSNIALSSEKINNLQSGWTLIGTSLFITDMSIFDSVSIIWTYNNATSSWSAYSSNATTEQLIRNKSGINFLTTISVNSGIWVYKK